MSYQQKYNPGVKKVPKPQQKGVQNINVKKRDDDEDTLSLDSQSSHNSQGFIN